MKRTRQMNRRPTQAGHRHIPPTATGAAAEPHTAAAHHARHRPTVAVLPCAVPGASVLSPAPVTAQQLRPLGDGDSILFIGNSFTSWFGPLPRAVQAVYRATDPYSPVVFHGDNTGKGYGVFKEYVVLEKTHALEMIRQATWKYVVLQTYEDAVDVYDIARDSASDLARGGYPHNQDTLIKYYGILHDSITAAGGEPMLYAPHFALGNYTNGGYDKAMECFDRLVNEADVPFFVPVYQAWDSVIADYPPTNWTKADLGGDGFIEMQVHDWQHQNNNGMALDAFTWYTVLSGGASPVGSKPQLPTGGVDVVNLDTALFDYLSAVGYAVGRRILTERGLDDLDPPSTPSGVTTSDKTASTITLSWSPSTDNVGVTGYEVLVDGAMYGTTAATTIDFTIDMAEDRNLTVRACDAAGHHSRSSLLSSAEKRGQP